MVNVTAVVLTFNESLHLRRCLASLQSVATEVLVVDCYSTDDTPIIATSLGAKVIQHSWINYATQFNWGLTQLPADTQWVLRIDADEFLTPDLAQYIQAHLPKTPADVEGIYIGRRMAFQGRLIRHGGVFPVDVIRLFRLGKGHCENRWMDEHIKVAGRTLRFSGELIDDNLNNLTWWTDKHNKYASREVVDLLNLEFGFMPHDTVAQLKGGTQAGVKRWIKEKLYRRVPMGMRAFLYFMYRYVVRLGFLDGQSGLSFHFLQGFWYRYLVDAKLLEVKRYMRDHNVDVQSAIEKVLSIKLTQ